MTCFILLAFLTGACTSTSQRSAGLADELEQSLFEDIIDPWYPRCLDTIHGGYLPNLEYDWSISEGSQQKALVHQSRHLWTTSFLFEHYPEHPEFLEYAHQGFRFLEQNYQDTAYGGLFHICNREGSVDSSTIQHKRIYGQAFAINGLAQYYRVSRSIEALNLAKKTFHWMEKYPRDQIYGGYFETIGRDGMPITYNDIGSNEENSDALPLAGLKEFNSSLHILEAFTELYRVWPDSLLRKRLEEMYLLFRDVLIQPDGYLGLYFYPDWTLVPKEEMMERSGGNPWFTQHVTFGHDVEAAFLLLEAADALGRENDEKAQHLAKQLVDHALEHGWDEQNGGFYYIGYKERDGTTSIFDDHKAFWVTSEGLNALMLMHTLYPRDEQNYLEKFGKLWEYTTEYMIDHEYGGWYNYGLDTNPGNSKARKSHNWKATYHNVRGMVRSIEMIRKTN